MKRVILLLPLFFGLCLPMVLTAQETIQSITTIDWQLNVIDVIITAQLPPQYNVLPEAKIKAENKIEDIIPIIIQQAMENLILDSNSNVFDRLKTDLHLSSLIDNYSNKSYKINTHLTKNLKKIKEQYQIPLYPDFCSTFITHKKATPIKRIMHYVPSSNYTGIIIYASDLLPVYGENATELLTPSLFPKILNSNGTIIFSPMNMPPKILKKQGAALYVSHLDDAPKQRIGLLPLKIKATALFGRNRTDIVIPSRLSDKILVRKNNIELLKEGKIVIICNSKKLQENQYFNK